METETKFYNAVNIACHGEYFKIKSFRDQSSSWVEAWQIIEKGLNPKVNPDKELGKLRKLDIDLILKNNPNYPQLLKEMAWPPFGLYIKGDISIAKQPAVAIVGTRKATDQGLKIAGQLASELSQKLIIVSGLALGIDEAAHWGTVNSHGKTVAVIACGLERVYPAQNKKLADKILKSGGAIISEYPLESITFQNHFLERNRIISGLSLGTIVVEAPEKSGALATAKFALAQNRDVFAVPGPIYHQNSSGVNNLLKMGAYVVTEANDVLNCLNLPENFIEEKKAQLPLFDNEEQKKIFVSIKSSPSAITIDKISEVTKLTPQTINQSLSLLIINNLVKESGGRYTIP